MGCEDEPDHFNRQPVMHGSAQEPATEGFPFVALLAFNTAALGAHCLSYKYLHALKLAEYPDSLKSSCIEGNGSMKLITP